MDNKVILFLVTSGGGLGHLTRSLAIATQIRVLSPEFEIIFVTSSNAVEVIRREGFLFYYIPNRNETSKIISNSGWMHQMEVFLKEIVWLHKPTAVIYDAAYPYQVVRKVLQESGVLKTIWIKRECYKSEVKNLDRFENEFGRIITPRELPYEASKDTEKKKYVDPIMYLDLHTMYDRQFVRNKYQVKRKKSLLYLQLGAGIINDTRGRTAEAMEVLAKRKGCKILIGEYLMTESVWNNSKDIVVEREYPISKYFSGIDLAITAAGYNTFHEILACGVSTLFVPNEKTYIDDQRKRAMLAQDNGLGLCLGKSESMKEGISRLFECKEQIKRILESYHSGNGAVDAAKYILQYIDM